MCDTKELQHWSLGSWLITVSLPGGQGGKGGEGEERETQASSLTAAAPKMSEQSAGPPSRQPPHLGVGVPWQHDRLL